jgi:hypothetical protein
MLNASYFQYGLLDSHNRFVAGWRGSAPYDVYVMFNEDVVFNQGHSAIAIVTQSGMVEVYSYQSDNGFIFGGGAVATESQHHYNYYDFLQDAGNISQRVTTPGVGSNNWHEEYDNYIALKVFPSQVVAMDAYASEFSRNPTDYNVFSHNCYDFVADVLAAGNVTLDSGGKTLGIVNVPNEHYKNFTGAEGVVRYAYGSY